MERKSIGQFISALRKANGMTQKQLADLLHVSDKAVSRWERDESAPDLPADFIQLQGNHGKRWRKGMTDSRECDMMKGIISGKGRRGTCLIIF